MNVWMDVWMHVCMEGCMYLWMDGWMYGWMYGFMDVWTYGCVDVWMNVWMYRCMYRCMHGCMDGWIVTIFRENYFDRLPFDVNSYGLVRTRKIINGSVHKNCNHIRVDYLLALHKSVYFIVIYCCISCIQIYIYIDIYIYIHIHYIS